MDRRKKTFTLVLVALFFSSLVILQPINAKTTILETIGYYAIPDENVTIILPKGSSFGETTNFYPAHNTSEGFVPSSWLFALFSTGNGTTGLTISAHDCNVTITSYNYYQTDMGDYYFRADSWLNDTTTGIGTQLLHYSQLFNSNNSNPNVYIDGIAKEKGDRWDWNNFGITVNGALSTVSIHQESLDYLPPRNPRHLEPINYVLPISVMLTIVIVPFVLVYRTHRKNAKSKQGPVPTVGCITTPFRLLSNQVLPKDKLVFQVWNMGRVKKSHWLNRLVVFAWQKPQPSLEIS